VDFPATDPLVRFVMVSSGITFKDGKPLEYSRNSERWRWTADAIDGAAAAMISWTVVGMHTPCLSVGRYHCQAGKDFNMLTDKEVDLVVSGHEHIYQRTHQLGTGTDCLDLVPRLFRQAASTIPMPAWCKAAEQFLPPRGLAAGSHARWTPMIRRPDTSRRSPQEPQSCPGHPRRDSNGGQARRQIRPG
jgi:hypothetical protein